MRLFALRSTIVMSAFSLMTAVVSAQGEAPGSRPAQALPSNQVPGVLGQVAFAQRLNAVPVHLDGAGHPGTAWWGGEVWAGSGPSWLAAI